MSYDCSGTTYATRVNHYSNLNSSYNSRTTGTVDEDNARVLNENRSRYEAYRPAVSLTVPGIPTNVTEDD